MLIDIFSLKLMSHGKKVSSTNFHGRLFPSARNISRYLFVGLEKLKLDTSEFLKYDLLHLRQCLEFIQINIFACFP